MKSYLNIILTKTIILGNGHPQNRSHEVLTFCSVLIVLLDSKVLKFQRCVIDFDCVTQQISVN